MLRSKHTTKIEVRDQEIVTQLDRLFKDLFCLHIFILCQREVPEKIVERRIVRCRPYVLASACQCFVFLTICHEDCRHLSEYVYEGRIERQNLLESHQGLLILALTTVC